MPEEKTDPFDTLRLRITDWLLAESWQVKETTAQARGAAWVIQATDPRGKVVLVGQEPEKPDVLILQGPIAVGEGDRKLLAALGAAKNEALCWDLRFQLLNLGVQFNGVAVPLERINLVLRLYTDSLDRNRFFERLDRLQSGIQATIWMIRRRLDRPAPKEEASGLAVN